MIILCVLALLFFLIENNIITGKFVMFFMVVSIFMYMYNNRLYTDRIDDLKSQIEINSFSDVITKMCNSTPDSEFCASFIDEQNKFAKDNRLELWNLKILDNFLIRNNEKL